jgi:hypothetical protein
MAVAQVNENVCVLCEETVVSKLSGISVSAPHTLFPEHANVKNALKAVMLREMKNIESSFIDAILDDRALICNPCVEKMATCAQLQRRIDSAEKVMHFALREGQELIR